jgi:hypothetical protein
MGTRVPASALARAEIRTLDWGVGVSGSALGDTQHRDRRQLDSSSIRACGTSARTRTSSDTVISGVRSAFRIA